MDVISRGALRVASIRWQPRQGAFVLTVVCKATFTLRPGESPLAPDQEAPNDGDGHWDDDASRSLCFATDLVPWKQRADVLLVGSAFAPEGRPTSSLVARMTVGEIDKAIAVFADRAWTTDGAIQERSTFVKMSLAWERAAGGPGTANPVGVRTGRGAPSDKFGRVAMPNLESPGAPATSRDEPIAPAGLGPIAPGWPSRAALASRIAGAWRPGEGPPPVDLDPSFFNAAPRDQQPQALRGDEKIALQNLHPDHATLVTTLARVAPRASVTRGAEGIAEDLPLACDTLTIDTDHGTCSLTWRGHVALRQADEAGRVVVTDAAGAIERAPEAPIAADAKASHAAQLDTQDPRATMPISGAWPTRDAATDATLPPPAGAVAARTPLPFAASEGVPSWIAVAEAAIAKRAPSSPDIAPPPPTPRTAPAAVAPPSAPRFSPAPPGAPLLPAVPPAAPRFFAPTMTAPPPTRVGPATPFSPRFGPPAVAASSAAPPATPVPPVLPPAPPALLVPLAVPRFSPPPMEVPAKPRFAPVPPVKAPIAPAAPRFSPTPITDRPPPPEPPRVIDAPPAELPAPPPMIGPLAKVEMPPETAAPEATAALAATAVATGQSADLPLAAYPIERCAAIAASVARRRAHEAAILAENELDPALWARLDGHWREAIRQETSRGKTGLLETYDKAYLGRLEQERGPIGLDDYARLVVAAERGGEEDLLARMTLPRGAKLRIERVWLRRIFEEPDLGDQVSAAVTAARDA